MLQVQASPTLRLVDGPTTAAIDLAAVKLHLRVTSAAEDDLINALITSATIEAEHLMGRAIMPQSWQLTLDAFEPSVPLRRPTVTAIESITYLASADGVSTVLDPGAYQLVAASDLSASVVPAFGLAWPTTRAQPEAVRIVFTCGYADAAAVPEPIRTWLKMRIGALYENRAAWTLGKAIEQNPFVDNLLDRFRVWSA